LAKASKRSRAIKQATKKKTLQKTRKKSDTTRPNKKTRKNPQATLQKIPENYLPSGPLKKPLQKIRPHTTHQKKPVKTPKRLTKKSLKTTSQAAHQKNLNKKPDPKLPAKNHVKKQATQTNTGGQATF
jgi:hypothetical protein